MIAQLVPLDGGKPILLDQDVTLVGRKKGLCDLFIDHHSISKLQCVIVKTDGLLFIRDLCSTNGTKVNGQRVSRGALLPGDELAFASVKYRVQMGAGESRVPSVDKTEMMTSFPAFPQNRVEEPAIDRTSESDVRLLSDSEILLDSGD
ncbi:MAG: FHA domain-containing protein [Planctomycetaceae bacterium]